MTQQGIVSSLAVFDYGGHKLCDLYDSQNDLAGQAYGITFERNMTDGIKSLQFTIPYHVDKEKNFRWQYLKSEYLIRFIYKNKTEWFIAQKPKKSKSSKEIVGTVTCAGIEASLKTKNIYMEFDDENGIGTIDQLADRILAGTGWHRGYTDPMLESDGETEKIRSMSGGGKTGALGLMTTLCNLFKCYPVYKTDTKTVELYNYNNRDQVLEGTIGINLDELTVDYNSSDIITRLYVEGEYGDYGYVGIDDVNPTGLSYIMNFDYYREIGVFTPEHEEALQTYVEDISEVKEQIEENTANIIAESNLINGLIGQCDMVLYYQSEGWTHPVAVYGEPDAASQELAVGDKVVVLKNDGTFRYATITTTPAALIQTGEYGIAKFITPAAGSIGAYEVQIEAKEKEIENLQKKIAGTKKEEKKADYRAKIYELQDEINYIYNGSDQSGNIKATLSQKYIPEGYDGNVDLVNRIIIPSSLMVVKWSDFSGTYATLYSQTYSAGTTSKYDFSYNSDKVISVTPIKADGTILNKSQLESYLRTIISAAKSNNTSIMVQDNQGLVLRETAVSGAELRDVIADESAWCASLSSMQEQWDSTRSRYNFFGEADVYDPHHVFGDTSGGLIGLYAQMDVLMREGGYMRVLGQYNSRAAALSLAQDDIESDFIIAMGDMLRDGYMNDQNYVEGQELHLYNDAVERLEIMSRPSVSYSFNLIRLSKEFGIPIEDFKLNAIFKIHDDELNVHDKLFVTKIKIGVDDESSGSIDVSNKDITLSSNDLGALLSRMSQLADLIEQKNTLYERAKAITKNKTIYVDRLNGQINVLKNQLLSTVSNWYTDEQGNLMFLSADGGSAMMLCGAGFMIANSKDSQGEWNWRTFGTGEGFTADEIVAGYISAERIEAGSIATSKLEPDAGNSLIISGNPSIEMLNESIAPPFVEGQAYSQGDYVSYNGSFWVFTADYAGGTFADAPVSNTSVATQIELLPDQIIQYVGTQGYGKTFITPSNPVDQGEVVVRGDYWVLAGNSTDWAEILIESQMPYTGHGWNTVKEHAWGYYSGYNATYCYDGTNWVEVSDASKVADAHTQITQTSLMIQQEVARANAAEGDLQSLITQTADAITSEVTRAKTNETKISTSVTQTADMIAQEVTRATAAENSKIAKTSQYQTASSIVSAAESYTDNKLTNYSTIEQTSESIELYVGDHAYQLVSGLTITSAGIKLTGSQYIELGSSGHVSIEAGGYFKVSTGDFGINSYATTYVLWAGPKSDPDSTSNSVRPFYVTKQGKVKATLGSIGGWTLGADYIGNKSTRETSTVALRSSTTTSDKVIWAGALESATDDNSKFYVKANGYMLAKSGTVGGWTIGSDYIGNASTKSSSTVGLRSSSVDSDWVIWAGSTLSATPSFYVKADGSLYAKNGTFSGTVYASKLDGKIDTNQIVQSVVTQINNGQSSYNYTNVISNYDSANTQNVRANKIMGAEVRGTSLYAVTAFYYLGHGIYTYPYTTPGGISLNVLGYRT